MWNISIAKYNGKKNAVAERTLISGIDWWEAEKYIGNNSRHPIYAWADGCAELDCPEMAMFISLSYHKEYGKVID